MSRFGIGLVVVALIAASPAGAQSGEGRYSEEIRRFEEFVAGVMEAESIPGISVAFSKDDFEWARGFGFADLENRVPAAPESAYRLASVTKTMTALMVVLLANEGKLGLDDEVQKYVEDFPEKPWPVTVRQLLGHLGGISHYRNYDEEGHFKTHYDTAASLSVFKDWDLEAEPGTRFRYTSYGYNLLGAVIEGASEQSFGAILRERIWKPLGMDATRMDDPVDLIPDRVRGYRKIAGEIKNSEFVDISSRFAAGGTRSTVLDLIQYARGLDRGKVLDAAGQRPMYDAMVTADGTSTGYGMGWGVGSFSGYWRVSHSGGQAETSTYLLRFPRRNLAIAVASNLERAPTSRVAFTLASLLLDVADVELYAVDPAHEVVVDVLRRVWRDGLAHHDRFGVARGGRDEVDPAFEFFRKTVEAAASPASREEARTMAVSGSHPKAGSPWVVMGSFMAHQIARGGGREALDGLRTGGPIPFFEAYRRLREEASSKIAATRSPGTRIEGLIEEWAGTWNRIWTKELRRLTLRPPSDQKGVAESLASTLSGSAVLPRLSGRLVAYADRLEAAGQGEEAEKVLAATAKIYPRDAGLWVRLGGHYLMRGRFSEARKAYDRTLSLVPHHPGAENGLAFLEAAGDRVELSEEQRQGVVGDYRFDALGYTVRVYVKENRLFVLPPASPPMEMIPLPDQRFVVWDPEDSELIRLACELGEDGRVDRMNVQLGGRRAEGLRVTRP